MHRAVASLVMAAPARFAAVRGERGLYLLFLVPLVALLCLLTVYPFLYSVVVSLTDLQLARPRQVVEYVGLANYIEMAQSAHFRVTVRNTLVLIAGAVSAQVVLGMALALLLNRSLPGFGLVRALFLLPTMIPTVVSALAWYSMYNATYGVINYALRAAGMARPPQWIADPNLALASIVVVDVWQWTPFVMLLLLAGLHTLPSEQLEAAAVEGAGSVATFFSVILPYLRPLLGVVLLFRTMDVFKMFDKIYILTQGGPGSVTETVTFHAFRQGFGFFKMGYASALSIFILAVVVALSILLIHLTQRREAG